MKDKELDIEFQKARERVLIQIEKTYNKCLYGVEMENISDYKPYYLGYGKDYGKIFYYDRSWFCEETSRIHSSEKSVLKCIYCKRKYYKDVTNETKT